MSERATPFHCPYCGNEDLRPHEVVSETGEVTSPHGTWDCRGCLRAFSLKMLGLVRPGTATAGTAAATTATTTTHEGGAR